jgi:NAD(P)-dependent dehydrogenase (short-subunit alcohol dehydrogenase family)
MRGLNGKQVLITGGARGIGAAIASRFLEEGAEVIIMDSDRDGCDRIAAQFKGMTRVVIGDVTDKKDVDQTYQVVDDVWSGLDVLINNAGVSIRHPFLDISSEEWSKVLRVNLDGVFNMAQMAAIRMIKRGEGVILNMGSTNGLTGYPLYADYNVSKAGVIELTRSIALELAPKVRVNAVCPGFILTPMQEAEYTPELMESFRKKIPLKRMGQPEEVAAFFAYLASDDAKFITGQCFVIDGGETAGGLASRD